jgi:hypothetical protein
MTNKHQLYVHWRRAAGAVVVASAIGGRLDAYNGNEHREVSNEALSLCFALLGDQSLKSEVSDERLTQAKQEVEFLLTSAKSSHPTYGDLVASVDHYHIAALDNDPGFVQFEARKRAQLHPDTRVSAPSVLSVGLRHINAVHHNELHFQGSAIQGIQYFHRRAIQRASEALDGKDLEGAFLLNAVADHLIEDFLAGGHVSTPRSDFHDMPSAIVHDTYNKIGVKFSIKREAPGWQAVERLAQRLTTAGPEGDPGKEASRLAAFIAAVDGDGGKKYNFKGDGFLHCSADQTSYIALLVTRSNWDVLESFMLRRPVDEIRTEDWSWVFATTPETGNYADEIKSFTPPQAVTSSGEYDLGQSKLVYGTRSLIASYSMMGDPLRYALRLDFRTDATVSGAGLRRVVEGKITDQPAVKQGWYLFSTGAAFIRSEGARGVDFHFTGTSPLTSRGTQLHFRVGLGGYEYSQHRGLKLNGGVGIEQGYGILFGHIGIERDYIGTPGGHLHGRFVPSVGMTFMLPQTWVHHLKPSPKCRQD